MSKKNRPNPPPRQSIEDILRKGAQPAGSRLGEELFAPPPDFRAAIKHSAPSPVTGDDEALLKSFSPSKEEHHAGPILVTCFGDEWDNFVRNYIFARHTDCGEKSLPDHLAELCDPEMRSKTISTAALMRAGWQETEKLFKQLSTAVFNIHYYEHKKQEELRLQKDDKYRAAIESRYNSRIDDTRKNGLIKPLTDYLWDHHMYSYGMNYEAVRRNTEEHAATYEEIIGIAFLATDEQGRNNFSFLPAIRKLIMDGPEALSAEQKKFLEEHQPYADTWIQFLQYAGQAQAGPLAYIHATLEDAKERYADYKEHLRQAEKELKNGNPHSARATLKAGMEHHREALDRFVAAREAFEPVTQAIEGKIDIMKKTVVLEKDTLNHMTALMASLPEITKSPEIDGLPPKIRYARGKIPQKGPLAKQENAFCAALVTNLSSCIGLLNAESVTDDGSRERMEELQAMGVPGENGTLAFASDSRQFLNVCFDLRKTIIRLGVVKDYTQAIVNLAEAAERPKGDAPLAILDAYDHRTYALDAPPSQGLKAVLHHAKAGAQALLAFAREKEKELRGVLDTMTAGYDTFDLTCDQCARLRETMDTYIMHMRPRQQEWDERQRGATAVR